MPMKENWRCNGRRITYRYWNYCTCFLVVLMKIHILIAVFIIGVIALFDYTAETIDRNCDSFSYESFNESVYNYFGGDMNFGEALEKMKNDGCHVARSGWNGKGMYLFVVQPTELAYVLPLPKEDTDSAHAPSIAMRTADGTICVGWLASQADMFAEDWVIVRGE